MDSNTSTTATDTDRGKVPSVVAFKGAYDKIYFQFPNGVIWSLKTMRKRMPDMTDDHVEELRQGLKKQEYIGL